MEARFWTRSNNSTNSTGVYGLHFLNVHLTGRSGDMTYEVMEMITVEPNVRDSDRDPVSLLKHSPSTNALSTDFPNSGKEMLA